MLSVAACAAMTGCSDNNDLGDAPRLFRPVASATVNRNNLEVSWDKISGASQYELKLWAVTGTDEAGNNIVDTLQTATTDADSYTFSNLEWDEKYGVSIKCLGSNKESERYDVKAQNITYPTKISGVKLVDNAARISWDEGEDTICCIKAIPATGTDTVTAKVSEAQYAMGYADVYGLSPETSYTFKTYVSNSEISTATYAGRTSGTTKAGENFDEKYGAGNWIDIRDYDVSAAKDTLKTADFWENIKDGMTIILRGEQEYKVSGDIKFDRSVNFITGMTLGGNAKFISSGGMTLNKGVTVKKVSFEDIDFYADGDTWKDDNLYISNETLGDFKFSGKQVFNCNGTGSTLNEIVFTGCVIRGYRAVVRMQAATDNVQKVTFKGCTINGVGDQGVVTTNKTASDLQEVTFDDCTLTNIVMLTDLQAAKSTPTVNVNNCTFCYAPIETTADAKTPLFRFLKQAVNLNIEKSVFGPSMASDDSKGTKPILNTAGPKGSVMLNAENAVVSVNGSYRTKFDWTTIGTDANAKTYPIDALESAGMTETELWNDPAKGDFKFKSNLPIDDAGASKWRK